MEMFHWVRPKGYYNPSIKQRYRIQLLHRSVLFVRVTSLADQELFNFKQGITI
jgi:hypothetical protein